MDCHVLRDRQFPATYQITLDFGISSFIGEDDDSFKVQHTAATTHVLYKKGVVQHSYLTSPLNGLQVAPSVP